MSGKRSHQRGEALERTLGFVMLDTGWGAVLFMGIVEIGVCAFESKWRLVGYFFKKYQQVREAGRQWGCGHGSAGGK